jgi:hypothetical protein
VVVGRRGIIAVGGAVGSDATRLGRRARCLIDTLSSLN